MHVLICTLVRSNSKTLHRYLAQLRELVRVNRDIKFSISIFENDSVDDSKAILGNFDFEKDFIFSFLSLNNIKQPYFSSVSSEERVKMMAVYKNWCLHNAESILFSVDKILFLDSDTLFYVPDVSDLLRSDYDIYSAYSLRYNGSPLLTDDQLLKYLKEVESSDDTWKTNLRDFWATRINDDLEHKASVFRAHLAKFGKDVPVFSTCGGFCVYNAQPFKQGLKFSHINLNTKKWDTESFVICQLFRKYGFDKVYLNKEVKVLHYEE